MVRVEILSTLSTVPIIEIYNTMSISKSYFFNFFIIILFI
nr:MAG TPA: hypothetical protein [Caudoviricetes sp.]